MKIRHKLLIVLPLVLMFIAFFYYGFAEPQSPVGHYVFHAGYLFPPTRSVFLKFYSWSLYKWNSGTIPSAIDEFIVCRLWYAENKPEWTGIIHFYLLQGPSRWSHSLGQSTDTLKSKVIEDLFQRFETLTPENQVDALILIECLRLEGCLYKGRFFSDSVYSWNRQTNEVTYFPKGIAKAHKNFKEWWSTGWPENKNVNPLQGTGMSIGGVP